MREGDAGGHVLLQLLRPFPGAFGPEGLGSPAKPERSLKG